MKKETEIAKKILRLLNPYGDFTTEYAAKKAYSSDWNQLAPAIEIIERKGFIFKPIYSQKGVAIKVLKKLHNHEQDFEYITIPSQKNKITAVYLAVYQWINYISRDDKEK